MSCPACESDGSPLRFEVRDPQGWGLAEITVGASLITLRVGGMDLHLTPGNAQRLRDALGDAILAVRS